MNVRPLALPEVLLVSPRVFRDDRGHFFESWNDERYTLSGMASPWVQDNTSVSKRGVLRGLHFQNPGGQGKLVTVLSGAVFDVAVDIRQGSPRFGQWVGVTLDGEHHEQLFVPPGFAHGFVALSETVVFSYKCTTAYNPATELSIRWDDPEIGIQWPEEHPSLAPKDATAPFLRDIPRERLPLYAATADHGG